jgi:hypothetical protein
MLVIGTVRWIIQDDNGRPHKFDIPGTYLVPELLIGYSVHNTLPER